MSALIKAVRPHAPMNKLGHIARTYRAGTGAPFDTCPATCSLLPPWESGTQVLDQDYLAAVLQAVPPGGESWTYSHFPFDQLPRNTVGTTINFSADTEPQAIAAAQAGHPTVYAAPHDDTDWPRRIGDVRFIECPAVTHPDKVTCETCGGDQGALCARKQRDYVVVFRGHGPRKKLVGSQERGGCYAECGPTRWQWNKTAKGQGNEILKTPEQLIAWARSLPRGSRLRHHVAGDLGAPARKVIPIKMQPQT